MPIKDEIIVKLRVFDGIDLNVDSRVSDPGAWKKLQNLYGRVPGRLSKRPGSVAIVSDIVMFYQNYGRAAPSGAYLGDLSFDGGFGVDYLYRYLVNTFNFGDSITTATDISSLHSFLGPATGGKACILGAATIERGAGFATRYVPMVFVGGGTGQGARLVNWMPGCATPSNIANQNGPWVTNDIVFTESPNSYAYAQASILAEASGDPQFGSTIMMPMFVGTAGYFGVTSGNFTQKGICNPYSKLIHTSGTVTSDNTETFGGIAGYVSDRHGKLSVLFDAVLSRACYAESDGGTSTYRRELISHEKSPEFMLGPAIFNSGPIGEGEWEYPANMRWFEGVQALHTYSGCLVIGGYTEYKSKHVPASGTKDGSNVGRELSKRAPHCVTFSEVNTGYVGDDSWIQIGANEGEPITAMGTVTTPTDNEGLKAQLAIFTSRKFVVYDGTPPNIADAAGGIDFPFNQTLSFGIGCVAPKTVVSTPEGLVFLGTDGVVYLIHGASGMVPLGRAIEPALKSISNLAMSRAGAVYDKGFYKLSVHLTATVGGADEGGFDDYGDPWDPQGDGFFNSDDAKEAPSIPPIALTGAVQYWADLRAIRGGVGPDMGVKWSGPHIGESIDSFAKLDGPSDNHAVVGTTLNSTSLVQINMPGVITNYDGSNIDTIAQSPKIDIEDAHIDKTYYGFELGVATDKVTNSTVTVSALSTVGCEAVSAITEVALQPCGLQGGNGTDATITTEDPNGGGFGVPADIVIPPTVVPSFETITWDPGMQNSPVVGFFGLGVGLNQPTNDLANAGPLETIDIIDPNGGGFDIPANITLSQTPAPSGWQVAVHQPTFMSDQEFTLYERRPWRRLRGRIFQATITETSTANLAYTDFAMRLRPSKRRE